MYLLVDIRKKKYLEPFINTPMYDIVKAFKSYVDNENAERKRHMCVFEIKKDGDSVSFLWCPNKDVIYTIKTYPCPCAQIDWKSFT